MKNSFLTKMSDKKGAETQPTNHKPQKNDLLTAKKIRVHSNGFSIETDVNSELPVDSECEGNISLPVLDAMSSPLATLPANKDVLSIKNPTDVSNSFLKKQTLNPEQSVMTSTSLGTSLSSNVTNLANKMVISSKTTPSSKDKVIFSSSLNTNGNPPIILAPPNNSVLQPTNWMTTPGQLTKWLTAPSQPTWPPNTVTYVLMSTGQSPVYLANSTNGLPQLLPTATTVSATTNTSTMDSSVALPSSATTTATATMPVTMRAAEGTAAPNTGGQLFSTKAIMPKSTFVQLPIQISTLVNQKIQNVSPQKQSFSQSTKSQKTLKQTNSENEKILSQIPLSVNIGILGNLSKPNCLKPEADNPHSPIVQSDVNSVSTLEKMSNDSSLSPCETRNNETTEFPKTDDSNLMAESCQTIKLSTSDDRTLLSKGNDVCDGSSMLEKMKAALSKSTNKPSRGRPKKFLVPIKYKRRQIPILPATGNTGIEGASKLSGFNLLPSGNYVICLQNKTNDELNISGIHSEEQKANVSQSEMNKLLTRNEKDNGSKNESMRQSSLEGKEMQKFSNEDKIIIKTETFDDESEGGNEDKIIIKTVPFDDESEGGNEKISNEDKIIIKTEPFDDESEGGNEKISNEDKIIIKTEPFDDESGGGNQDYNLSGQCTSSVTPFPADIGIHEENNSKTESTSTIQEKAEDNELVISSCFSLSTHSESKRKFLPFETTNSDLDNLFFLPQKTNLDDKTNLEDSNVIREENSTNVDNNMKRTEFPVMLELLNSSSDSLVLSSTEENQIPSSKSAEDTQTFCDSSTKKDKMNNKTLNESTSQVTQIKRSHEASHKSILEPECLKKFKGSDSLVDKTKISVGPFELNQSPLKSKFRCLPSSEGFFSIPHVNNSLTSDKSLLTSLLSTNNSMIGNLTKDKEADSFLEGCIAFHQQQLYLLQLQIDQHKTALEKLKKAQSYLQDTS